jgi:hypothetical protein
MANRITKDHPDYKHMVRIAVSVAAYGSMADLADLAGKNGDTGLSGAMIRSLIAKHGEALGIEYHAGNYKHGHPSNSNGFGRTGSGFGGYTPACVTISRELQKKIQKRLGK